MHLDEIRLFNDGAHQDYLHSELLFYQVSHPSPFYVFSFSSLTFNKTQILQTLHLTAQWAFTGPAKLNILINDTMWVNLVINLHIFNWIWL